MIAEKRRQEILYLLKKDNNVIVKELAESFKVTMETIRSDLEYICKKDSKVTKVHGGAYYKEDIDNTIPFQLRVKIMIDEKKIIAKSCASLVKSRDVIMLDSSTTSDLIAKAIIELKIPVVIITNNLSILTLCGPLNWIKLIGLGGILDRSVNAFNSQTALKELSGYHSDLTFLSPTAISKTFGISDDNQKEGEVRKIMAQNTNKLILAVDHTKFDKTKVITICTFDKVEYIISDEKLDLTWEDFCKNKKIKVITGKK